MSIPRLKQQFEIEYKYYENAVVCYVAPIKPIKYLDCEYYSAIDNEPVVSIRDGDQSEYKFKGVATLKPTDDKNLEAAEAIAKRKAMRSYYRFLETDIKAKWKEIERFVQYRMEFFDQVHDKIDAITTEIKEIAEET